MRSILCMLKTPASYYNKKTWKMIPSYAFFKKQNIKLKDHPPFIKTN